MRFQTAHPAGRKVGDDDDAAADQLLRRVPLGNAGEDLTGLIAQIDLEPQQLVGLGDALGDKDLGDAQVDLDEVVDGDLRSVGCRGRRGSRGKRG